MLKVACPNCGAEVLFRSPALPVKVCDYCRTAVTRIGEGVRSLGKVADLPFDVSPIRIGTRGRFDQNASGARAFEVIGRVRWGWTDGSWNEWLLMFDDAIGAGDSPWAAGGRPAHGWLGEAMGQFMLTVEIPFDEVRSTNIRRLAKGEKVAVGAEARIGDEVMTIADIKRARCISSEGELPWPTPLGWTIDSVDLRSPSGACASVQRDGQETSVYAGRYVTLDELGVTGLRAIEGWAMPRFAAG